MSTVGEVLLRATLLLHKKTAPHFPKRRNGNKVVQQWQVCFVLFPIVHTQACQACQVLRMVLLSGLTI